MKLCMISSFLHTTFGKYVNKYYIILWKTDLIEFKALKEIMMLYIQFVLDYFTEDAWKKLKEDHKRLYRFTLCLKEKLY